MVFFFGKTVIIQLLLNLPKHCGYYTFTIIYKPWLIFVGVV